MPLDGHEEDKRPGLPILIAIDPFDDMIDITYSVNVDPQTFSVRTLDNQTDQLAMLWKKVKGDITRPLYEPMMPVFSALEAIVRVVRAGQKVDLLLLNQADIAIRDAAHVMLGQRCDFTIDDRRQSDESED